MKNIIEIKGLNSIISTTRRNKYVLNDIIFSIPKGKIIGIIGESGSGKTQLMHAITGSQNHSPGVVSGEVIYDLPPLVNIYPSKNEFIDKFSVYRTFDDKLRKRNADIFDRRVESKVKSMRGEMFGIIPQDCGSFLNPYWNIETFFKKVYIRQNNSKKYDQLKFNSFLKHHIEKFDLEFDIIRNKYPHELSGGEAQRVMNAFVFAHNPKVLFVDEGTTGLDVSRQKKVISEVKKMIENRKDDTAIVLISHDIAFLNHLVDVYFVMYSGFLLEAIHNKDRLLEKESLHPYTADLISSLKPSRSKSITSNKSVSSESTGFTEKPEGCPYRMKCRLFESGDADLRNKCSTDIPPLISHDTKKEVIAVDSDWLRCWAHNSG